MATDKLTAKILREHLTYDPETGSFRRIRASGTSKVGDVAGWLEPSGYIKISICGAKYFAHRCAMLYITGEWPQGVVDHIDGDRTNNRFANLRDVTQSGNMQNLRGPRSDNKSGFLGVSFHAGAGKYMAEIKSPTGERKYLGLYETAEKAYEMYLKAKREMHPFATL